MANELMHRWANASSYTLLPDDVKENLEENVHRRRRLVSCNSQCLDDTCVPFTKWELLNAVKKGRSTAPGEDGLTYDVINWLIGLDNSPILDLFNLSYRSGRLPCKWKTALIVPIPKHSGDFRPISLTSCLCKMMERVVLHRLL